MPFITITGLLKSGMGCDLLELCSMKLSGPVSWRALHLFRQVSHHPNTPLNFKYLLIFWRKCEMEFFAVFLNILDT